MSYPDSKLEGYVVRPAVRQQIDLLIKAHYLHRWPGVVVACLALMRRDQPAPVGAIVFALPPRETMKRYNVNLAWELARLYVLDSEPFNIETWFMARAVKWVKKNRPDVELLVSYADPSANHQGTIYKAGNWKADGRTDQERKSPRCDYRADGKLYSRRSHVPAGVTIVRVPRVSKFRFIYNLR